MAAKPGKSAPDASLIKKFYPMRKLDTCSQEEKFNSDTLRYMKQDSVFDQSRKSAFEQKVKNWLKEYIITNCSEEDVVIAIAPGHEAYNESSFMYKIVRQFISEYSDIAIEDGSALLVRYKSIEKQATSKGIRSESTHRESIRIKDSDKKDVSLLNEGKIVIILDDIWTSGCTLRVCEEKMRTTGPKDVKLLAIGKTV